MAQDAFTQRLQSGIKKSDAEAKRIEEEINKAEKAGVDVTEQRRNLRAEMDKLEKLRRVYAAEDSRM